jgi:cell wall-associated NlpC family hydrolase
MDSAKYHSEIKEVWQSGVLQDLFPGDLMVELGRCFLKAPYRAGALDLPGRERLVVNLSEFDCMTFVETILALAMPSHIEDLSPLQFKKNLKRIRYRHGVIAGYASRLHYFSDWLMDNQKKKILKDITSVLGGKPKAKKIHFMTTHRELYPGLKNKTAYDNMRRVEKNLSRRTYHVIERHRISTAEKKIRNGDILAFTTDEPGLDVLHVGLAVKTDKGVFLLHASRKAGTVTVSRKTLAAYVKSNPKMSGLIVARACLNPRTGPRPASP